MLRPRHLRSALRRLARDRRGAALVEFAIALPFLMFMFAVIVEGSRLMWAYQSTITSVRDATRYLARAAAADICAPGYAGPTLASHQSTLNSIVGGNASRNAFPSLVTITAVTPSLACRPGSYRVNPAPVVMVEASVTVNVPFASLFALVGGSLPNVTTTVTDESRVFGT